MKLKDEIFKIFITLIVIGVASMSSSLLITRLNANDIVDMKKKIEKLDDCKLSKEVYLSDISYIKETLKEIKESIKK